YLAGATIEKTESEEAASQWIKFEVNENKALLVFRWILALISITATLFWQFNSISDFQFILLLLIPIAIIGVYIKSTNKILFTASKGNEKWYSMQNRLKDLHRMSFKNSTLANLSIKLTGEKSTAS